MSVDERDRLAQQILRRWRLALADSGKPDTISRRFGMVLRADERADEILADGEELYVREPVRQSALPPPSESDQR